MPDDTKVRINITIGEEELQMARESGESVSGYIRRLIREDAGGAYVKVPMPPAIHRIVAASGVLEGDRAQLLLQALTRVLAEHADAALMASRESLKAVITGTNQLPK